MNIVESNTTEHLSAILAVYTNRVAYHEVLANKRLGVGKPLTVEASKTLFSFMDDAQQKSSFQFKSLIPSNVLYFDFENPLVIWHTKPQIQHLYFKEFLPIHSGKYPIPALVWKLDSNKLQVYAIKDQQIDKDTKLYQAPFLNVSSSGSVCMGNARFKSKSNYYDHWISKAQEAFFNSVFTHTNTDELLKLNIVDYLQELSEKKPKTFKNSLLLPLNRNLTSIL